MGHRGLFKRRARFAHQKNFPGLLVDDLYEEYPVASIEFNRYRDWLLAAAERRGHSGRVHRALIRAEHRYRKLDPVRLRARALHQAYAKRR